MQWFKAGIIGLIGSLIIFGIMLLGIKVTSMAPFNMPPSAAFLKSLGFPVQPLALIVHFVYGAIWAIVLWALFGARTNLWSGLGLAVIVQWLLLMQLVYSPIIGWGMFGLQAGVLPADAPLALNSTMKYLAMTLVLHIVYGALNGWLIPKWIGVQDKGRE